MPASSEDGVWLKKEKQKLTKQIASIINLHMKKRSAPPTLTLTKDTLCWAHTEHVIAYPIFIRDPAQQRQFLSAVPKGNAISLNFTSDTCHHRQITHFGRRFTQSAPEKVILITMQDMLTRHGYRVGRLLTENKEIHHWISHTLGYLAWGIAVLVMPLNAYLFATLSTPTTTHPVDYEKPTISPLLLQKLAELPGAISQLEITPQSGHIQAYIPQEKQEEFRAYITQKTPQFPIKWQHKILGKTKSAFVWEGEWTQP